MTYPSTPTVNTHLVQNVHLLPTVYLLVCPLVDLPRIVPRFAKSLNYLWIVGLLCGNQSYQITDHLAHSGTPFTSTEANLTSD